MRRRGGIRPVRFHLVQLHVDRLGERQLLLQQPQDALTWQARHERDARAELLDVRTA